MNDPIYRDALLTALAVAAVLLLGYQGFMLWWTKKTVGTIPKPVLVLRTVNVVLLLTGCALVIWQLAR